MIEILLPFYGDAGYLRAAVDSVLAQSDPAWRLHVVDDAYPDPDAAAWIAAIDDPRVSFQRNATNRGVAANFAHCLERATAEHVAFLGGDDLLGPTYVASVRAAFARHPEVALVQPGVRVIDSDGRDVRPLTDRVKRVLAPTVHRERVLTGEALARSLLHGDWMYFPSISWRRDVIATRPFRQDMQTVMDLALLLDLVLAGESFLVLEDPVFEYRRHAASASSVTAREADRFDEEERLFAEVAQACRDRGWRSAARAARWHLTSRLHATLRVPAALAQRDRHVAHSLVRHVTSRGD